MLEERKILHKVSKVQLRKFFRQLNKKTRRQKIPERRQNHHRIDEERPNFQLNVSLGKEHRKKMEDRKLWEKESKLPKEECESLD